MTAIVSAWRSPLSGSASASKEASRKRPGPVRSTRTGTSGQPKRRASCAGAAGVMASMPKNGTEIPSFIF